MMSDVLFWIALPFMYVGSFVVAFSLVLLIGGMFSRSG